MTRPNLQRATAISFGAHMVVFLVALVILSLRPSIKNRHYTVRLVSPGAPTQKASQPEAQKSVNRTPPPKKKTAARPERPAPKPKKKPSMAVKEDPTPAPVSPNIKNKAIEKLRQEKEAREAEEHKQAMLDKLRKEKRLQDIRDDRATKGAAGAGSGMSDAKKQEMLSAYSASIRKSIEGNWVFPDGATSVRAEVSITVFADGTMKIEKITTPSGNRAFDQSVLKAIKKTRTVKPPPFGRNQNVTLNFVPIK